MRPAPISKSLYRSVTWMGMERIPGALWIITTAILILMGFMYAKAYVTTLILVSLAGVGVSVLRRIGEYDAAFFKVIIQRKNYQDSYPSYTSSKGGRDG
jgi:type IV secretory pathway TrbD component